MRRTGKTTRLIDAAIQELFTRGEVWVPDRAMATRLLSEDGMRGMDKEVYFQKCKFIDQDHRTGSRIQDDVLERFRRRLYMEHNHLNNGFEEHRGHFKLKG